ncbi:hypothetical protein [Streptomyces sp. PAN_FS17]|uniref:hypothetical protein n=1 Tax=Streptomyces sp. PAN_FS17 TaxID=1855351 RepID=UPI0008982684|nr:hypothetical protein [Streptomyces sp. PAN_FS17]SED00919.1 hypothetical protein SAMN05216482_5550 [Streptomyces sp. PAN_FS17]
MRANTSPTGLALLLIVVGLLLSFTSITAAFVTDERVWRYLIAAGCFMQFLGWMRHGARSRGGAR